MKSVFITGANRGLGYGFAEYFLSKGFQVFAGTRTITDELPKHDNLIWIQCDVTEDDSIDKAVSEVKEKTNNLTYLINNAGVSRETVPSGNSDSVSILSLLDRKALLDTFNINSIGPIIVTKKFLPLLTDNFSFVINISSARASFNSGRGATANYGYSASKVALNMFTYCSKTELPHNVKTFAVNPGRVKTDMNPDVEGDPVQKAEKIIGLTMENWKEEYNGRFLDHDGSFYPL